MSHDTTRPYLGPPANGFRTRALIHALRISSALIRRYRHRRAYGLDWQPADAACLAWNRAQLRALRACAVAILTLLAPAAAQAHEARFLHSHGDGPVLAIAVAVVFAVTLVRSLREGR